MTDKSKIVLMSMMMLTLAVTAVAQAQTESEIAVARADLMAERQAVVAANLPMTETESAAFWPLYRAYREEMAAIGDKSLQLVTTYANSYSDATLTDEQGVQLTKDFLKLQKETTELKQKYVGKFGKILTGKALMRFYQIENKLDAVVAVSIADQIPLVE